MGNWHQLYVENARIYQPVLEAGIPSAPAEARGLQMLFNRFGPRIRRGRRPRVLDVGCGIGRHSVSLAKLGYDVVGFDFSPLFLRTARRLAKADGLRQDRVRFYEGDTNGMSEVLGSKGEGIFDAVICMDTSIVRKTLREEAVILGQISQLSHEGTTLVIETANRDHYLKYQKFMSLPLVQRFPQAGIQRHIRTTYDGQAELLKGEWKFLREMPNQDLKHLLSFEFECIMHSPGDLRLLLGDSGWKCLACYGSVKKLNRLTSNSFHIVAVAKRV